MGLFDKIKNLFTEEVEEEIPVKKEMIKVEIAPPKIEENLVKRDIPESKPEPVEEKPSFPVFDDSDFDDLLSPKEEKPNIIYGAKKEAKKEEKKPFKPSPIISPVYGILDKNYTKEDITTKTPVIAQESRSIEKLSIDDIRKKAYGTLEEELETELFSKNSILFKEYAEDEERLDDLFLELEENNLENNDNTNDAEAISEEENTLTLEEEIIKINYYDGLMEDRVMETRSERNKHNTELEEIFEEDEPLNEGDLFNLIDSMYEKGEEEEK